MKPNRFKGPATALIVAMCLSLIGGCSLPNRGDDGAKPAESLETIGATVRQTERKLDCHNRTESVFNSFHQVATSAPKAAAPAPTPAPAPAITQEAEGISVIIGYNCCVPSMHAPELCAGQLIWEGQEVFACVAGEVYLARARDVIKASSVKRVYNPIKFVPYVGNDVFFPNHRDVASSR